MTDVDLRNYDAVGIAELVRGSEVSPVEVTEACLRKIEGGNPMLGAFVHVDAEAALARARGLGNEPLAGVPFAVKDVAGYPGLHWRMGSRLFAHNVAAEHSPYTRALDEAGLVIVGKTATSELGMLGSTETLLEGSTRNPWHEGLSAAGSSGGAAAAVAAGLLPMAHASDGGGSIRVPASVCGLFGFKPSNRRCHPTLPNSVEFSELLVDHCISRSVRDSAMLLALTERTGPGAAHRQAGFVQGGPDRPLSIAVWDTTLLGEKPVPEVAAAFASATRLCAELGHRVEPIPPPPLDGAAVSDGFFAAAGAAIDALDKTMTPMLGRGVGPDELEPFTLELLDWYRGLSEADRRHASQALEAAVSSYVSVFGRADVVLTPTLATLPWPLGILAPRWGGPSWSRGPSARSATPRSTTLPDARRCRSHSSGPIRDCRSACISPALPVTTCCCCPSPTNWKPRVHGIIADRRGHPGRAADAPGPKTGGRSPDP